MLQRSWTPYHYCLNNPVLHTDPNGEIIPLLAIAAVVVGKAVVGAAIDGGVQYTINRTQGMSHGDAINNLDYTSMGAAGVISAISVPGVSTGIKTAVSAVALTIDATVDISNNQTQTALGIGGANEKPLANVALDATIGALGSKASSNIVDGSKKAVANDLAPSNYAPLDATSKQVVRKTEAVVNSEGFDKAIDVTTGLVSGTISSSLSTDGTQQNVNDVKTFIPSTTQPADNTRVVQPILF